MDGGATVGKRKDGLLAVHKRAFAALLVPEIKRHRETSEADAKRAQSDPGDKYAASWREWSEKHAKKADLLEDALKRMQGGDR